MALFRSAVMAMAMMATQAVAFAPSSFKVMLVLLHRVRHLRFWACANADISCGDSMR